MHIHLPKPIHGWREFAGEVGIIVIGVLIALGCEQVVEAVHWQNEVVGFRDAVNGEIGVDLGTYPYRARQEACLHRRLDELERWLDSWRAGRPLKLLGPIGLPTSINIRTGVWDSRDPLTMSHMGRAERLDYGYLYGEFANNDVHRLDERTAWIEMNSFNFSSKLDHQDQIRLQGLLFRARLRDRRIGENYNGFIQRARTRGIFPTLDPLWPTIDWSFCQPLLAPARRQPS